MMGVRNENDITKLKCFLNDCRNALEDKTGKDLSQELVDLLIDINIDTIKRCILNDAFQVYNLVKDKIEPRYRAEENILNDCIEKYRNNDDKLIIAMKISLVDNVNTTQLSRTKKTIPLDKIVDKIYNNGSGIFDSQMIKANADYEFVDKLAKFNNKYNRLSFISKYCNAHNTNYPKYDKVVREWLPEFLDDKYGFLTTNHNIRENNYIEYCKAILAFNEDYRINELNKGRSISDTYMIDQIIWGIFRGIDHNEYKKEVKRRNNE